jgi:hypothetical protein
MKTLTTAQAAAQLGLSVVRVCALIRAGRLHARSSTCPTCGRAVYMLDASEISQFRRMPAGRPTGSKTLRHHDSDALRAAVAAAAESNP